MTTLRESFRALVASGDDCDLGRAALEIARIGYPDLDVAHYLGELDRLAAAIRPRLAQIATSRHPVTAVTEYLFDECGFRGNRDDYYDPRNSFLNDVLERRTGIPITLAVVLMETSTRLGLAVEGVGFPGHFLVRVAASSGPLLLDPFFGGRVIGHDEILDRLRSFYAAGGGPVGNNLVRELPQHLRATAHSGMLARMLANLLRIYLEKNDHEHALATVDLALVLNPDSAEYTRVRGLLYEQLDCVPSAVTELRRYLELAPAGTHASEVREHLSRLERVSVTVH